MKAVQFDITPDWLQKCENFARDCYPTNKTCYDKSEQKDSARCISQNVGAKLSELVVKEVFDTEYPDFKIYGAQDKRWGADCVLGPFNIHVKSQPIGSARKFGLSWTFNAQGKVRTDSVLYDHTENDIVVLCLVDWDKGKDDVEVAKRVFICAAVKMGDIFPYLDQPVAPYLKEKKALIYYRDLLQVEDHWAMEPLPTFTTVDIPISVVGDKYSPILEGLKI